MEYVSPQRPTQRIARRNSSSTEQESGITLVAECQEARSYPLYASSSLAINSASQSSVAEDDLVRFKKTLYALSSANRDEEAIAEALDYFDDRLIRRDFRECERALLQLEPSKLSTSTMVSILGITARTRELKSRARFYELSFKEIARLKGRNYALQLLTKYQ